MKPQTAINRADWDLSGTGKMTDKQRRMLNAVCGDLEGQIVWHDGQRLSHDDWRHMISGTMLGWRMMRGIDRGEGAPGLIMLGGSSLDLTRSMAADAITCGLHIGDHPEGQGLKCKPVHWCDAVLLGPWDKSTGHGGMIHLIAQSGNPKRQIERFIHPDWQAWMDASAYTHADARRELGLANGTFYRRIAKAPSLIDRLAMAALYEGLAPFTKRIEG